MGFVMVITISYTDRLVGYCMHHVPAIRVYMKLSAHFRRRGLAMDLLHIVWLDTELHQHKADLFGPLLQITPVVSNAEHSESL